MKKLLLPLFLASFFVNAATDAECTSKPVINGSMSGVYKEGDDRYVLLEGCIYRLSGVSVGTGDANMWNGTWTPVSSGAVGGGGSTGSGSSSTITSGQVVKLPDDITTLQLPSSVVTTDTVGTAFPVYAQNTSMMGSGFYIGPTADAVASYSILSDIKQNYNQPDIMFDRTDDFGNHVSLVQNSYKAVSYTVTKSSGGDSAINYGYVITTHTKRYDTSNVCTWPTKANDWKTQCDASRAVLVEDSYHTPEYGSGVMVMANINYTGSGSTGGSTGGPIVVSSGGPIGGFTGGSTGGPIVVSSGGPIGGFTGGSTGGPIVVSSGGPIGGFTGGSTGGSTGDGTGDFDYDKMAEANKKAMTEDVDASALQTEVVSSLDAGVQGITDSVSGLSDSVGGLVGKGTPVTGDFAGSAGDMQKIGSGDKSLLLDPFRKGDLFPFLPTAKQCTPFIFAAGKSYEFSLDCKYIDMFKSVFAFILYFWTFVSVYDSFTGILRKGKV